MNKKGIDIYLDEREKTLGKTIYHYCSFNTLEGIIQKRTIWLCSTATMNDRKEQLYFLDDLYKNVKEKIPVELLEKCNSFFRRIYDSLEREYPYAMCFSMLEDDAAQWERYGNRAEGICIGFNTKRICTLICDPMIIMRKINYGYDTKKHEHYDIILKYLIENEFSRGFTQEEYIIDNILACATAFKHESFSTEEECRFTTVMTWPLMEHSVFEYEVICGVVKKVLKIDLEALCQKKQVSFEDIIDRIIIGPRSKQTAYELKNYLRYKGFPLLAEKVYRSNCPLR